MLHTKGKESGKIRGAVLNLACIRILALFSVCSLISTCFSGCGKIGDPLPPIPRAPLTVDELTAMQLGSRIRLEFPLVQPPRAARIARVDVYRLIEPVTAPAGLPEEDFVARASIIGSLPAGSLPQVRATVSFEDSILPSKDAVRYRYAVQMVDRDGRAATLSNYATIEPLVDLALPPANLEAAVSQTEIVVRWIPPQSNSSGTSPANVIGYNLYRRSGDTTLKLNSEPITEALFTDRAFEFGILYAYVVRSLSPRPGNANPLDAIESDPSGELPVTPKDTFPPAAPDSIRIASINGLVSLFWPSNAEPDLAGYNVYRSEDEDLSPELWLKLTPRLHTPTTFRDDKVIVGRRYFYQLSAVDVFGNESARSPTVSEIVNP